MTTQPKQTSIIPFPSSFILTFFPYTVDAGTPNIRAAASNFNMFLLTAAWNKRIHENEWNETNECSTSSSDHKDMQDCLETVTNWYLTYGIPSEVPIQSQAVIGRNVSVPRIAKGAGKVNESGITNTPIEDAFKKAWAYFRVAEREWLLLTWTETITKTFRVLGCAARFQKL